jgi:type I restriction enzyme, S subunit
MIHDLKPYPAYKDSGVQWIGDVPEHWALQRLDKLFTLRCEPPEEGDQRVTGYLDGRVTLRANVKGQKIKGVIKEAGWQRVQPGDFAISGMNAHLGGMGVSDSLGKCSPIYLVLKPQAGTNAHFVSHAVRYAAHRGALKALVNTIRFNSADFKREDLKQIRLGLPDEEEQSIIVRFLDYADRRIRRYIHVKKKLMGLLNEQKQAIIYRVVTRGLHPNVRLKPSGVEWLGEVPEHWEVLRVKQLAQILRGKFTHRPRNDPSLYDGSYPFIQTGEVARAAKSITTYRQTLNERGLAVSKMFPAGTLVMTIAANIGDVAVLDFDACFPDSIVGFVPRTSILRDYLYYVFRTMKFELLREAPVSTQGNLNVERIGSRGISVPPVAEQQEIILHIEQSIADLNSAIERAMGEINLLREYRTRLIADVVTGKLDVREAAARLPEEIEEAEPLAEGEALADDSEDAEDAELDGAPEEAVA